MARRLAALLAICTTLLASGRPGSADWERGIEFYMAEEYREAQDQFERAASRDPENSEYQLWLGLAIGRRAEQMSGLRRLGAMSLAKQVKRRFERSVELDSSNVEALEALQGYHFQAPRIIGGSMAAAENIAGLIETVDKARGAVAWAAFHEEEGDFDKAGRHLERARELAPDDTDHLLAHAGFLARRGLHEESDELFEMAFARDPENPDVWIGAAKAWVGAKRKSQYARAKELLERYLTSPDRKPDSAPPSQVRKLLKRL